MDTYARIVVRRYANDVPVLSLQCATSHDDAVRARGFERCEGFFAEYDEPVPSVGVSEWLAVGHFFDVFGGVELR